MQYENNPANDFEDIAQKRNLSPAIYYNKLFKDDNPQSTSTPLRDVCVQYETNPAIIF